MIDRSMEIQNAVNPVMLIAAMGEKTFSMLKIAIRLLPVSIIRNGRAL